MKGTTAPLPVSDPGDLKNPPHVVYQFIDMILGDNQTLPAQQEQRWSHLATCVSCQAFLESYVLKAIEYDEVHGNAKGPAQELLIQLTQILHETLEEDMPVYIEVLEEQGEKEANSRFPQFAEHLHTCKECQAAVQDLRLWFHQV